MRSCIAVDGAKIIMSPADANLEGLDGILFDRNIALLGCGFSRKGMVKKMDDHFRRVFLHTRQAVQGHEAHGVLTEKAGDRGRAVLSFQLLHPVFF
jgi:hypothetical protein